MVELEVVSVVQRWHRMVERSNKPHNAECRERIRHIIESIGKSKDKSVQDRIAETERVKERKRTRIERGAGGCAYGTWDKMRRTVRFEQKAPNTIVFNHTCVFGVVLRVVGDKFSWSPSVCKIQAMLLMTYKISALDVLSEMDGRESRYIK